MLYIRTYRMLKPIIRLNILALLFIHRTYSDQASTFSVLALLPVNLYHPPLTPVHNEVTTLGQGHELML
jgi:hypothetical protein